MQFLSTSSQKLSQRVPQTSPPNALAAMHVCLRPPAFAWGSLHATLFVVLSPSLPAGMNAHAFMQVSALSNARSSLVHDVRTASQYSRQRSATLASAPAST